MLRHIFHQLRHFDWLLLGSVLLLLTLGLAALYSIATGADSPDYLNFKKQIIFACIGLAVMLIASFFDYRVWENYSYFFYAICVVLLIGVLFFGRTIRGTTGWYSVAGFNFQPVELAKIGLLAILAWFLSRRPQAVHDLRTFLLSGATMALLFVLVVLQPDFGSAIMLFAMWLVLVVLSGAQWKHLAVVAGLVLIALAFSWVFLFQDYQKDRINSFFDPQADPYGRGYHVRQAVTAVGAGGLLGRGLGFGSQSQLKFIPASETDFIFAVIAEELGFLGVSLMLSLWGLIFFRLYRAAQRVRDGFGMLFILGVSALFLAHITVNIGMNIGLLPVTGISLPFVSYGGSFLVVSLVLVGMVEGIIVRNAPN